MRKVEYNAQQLQELLCQSLEVEQGGVKIYETAVSCAQNEELREEWQKYLGETRRHVEVLTRVFELLGLDPETMTPGRQVQRHLGQSLVQAMQMAKDAGDPVGAELTACECVVLAETKDHSDWELIGQVVKNGAGEETRALKEAYEEVEQEEDHHLYHTKGWCRELWLASLGLPAVLPPPEEVKQVETAIGAARAENARSSMPKQRN
jgi:rubrerythrin